MAPMARTTSNRRVTSRCTVFSELSDEEAVSLYDRSLDNSEGCLDLVRQTSPTSVRYKKYAIEFFNHLQKVRDTLQRLAPGDRGGLAAAFSCSEQGFERVARLLVLLNGGVQASAEPEGGIFELQRGGGTAQEILGTDDRLDISNGAMRAYQSVAGVLDTKELAEAIERARMGRRKRMHRCSLRVAVTFAARASAARKSVAEAQVLRAMEAPESSSDTEKDAPECEEDLSTTTERLLQLLDDASPDNCHEQVLTQLMGLFDTDGDGTLTGAELNSFVDQVTDYVGNEFDQKFGRYGMKQDRTLIAKWVRGVLDQDGDGIVTKSEIANLKKIVDDVD